MVKQVDAQQLGSLVGIFCHPHILRRGCRIPAGVDMRNDDARCVDPHRFFEQLSQAYVDRVEAAAIDHNRVGDPVLGVQQKHPKLFLIKNTKRGEDMLCQITGGIGWRPDNDVFVNLVHKATLFFNYAQDVGQ